MANLFPYFDNGTFENYPAPFNTPPAPAADSYAIGKSTLEKRSGNSSLEILIGSTGVFPPDSTANSEIDVPMRSYYRPIVLDRSKRYVFKIWVKIRPGDPLGTDDTIVAIASGSTYGVDLGVGTVIASDAYTTTYQYSGISKTILKLSTVGQLKAANDWVLLSAEFDNTYDFNISLLAYVNADSGYITGMPVPPSGQHFLANGKIFFDDGTLEEVVLCDLALGSPSYNKTDETAFGANNGTVTINTTSSYIRTYAKGNIAGPYQSSNVFTGLAPGSYNFYIKDTNPNGCSQQILGVTILAAAAPPPPPPPPPVPGPLTIDAKPLNENNFVRWFSVDGYKNFNSLKFTNCCWDTPAAYRRQTMGRMNELRFAPIIVTNEKFTFYINFNTSLNDPDFPSYKIALCDYRGLVQDDIAILKKDLFDDGVHYNIYCDSILLSGVKVDHYYRYMIYNSLTNKVVFMSGEIQLLSTEKAACDSVRLQYRSTINLRGIRYESLPDFLNIQRMRFYRTDEGAEGTLDQYRAVSSGQLRNVAYEMDRFIELEAYYFDDQAHRAAEVWQMHDVNIVNDKAYIVKQLYKRDKAPSKSFYKGTVQLYEQAFSTQDRFNRLGNITVLSDLLLTEDNSRVKL